MKRGDLILVASDGDLHPRPALAVQNDAFDLHPTVVLLPLASELHDAPLFRIPVAPSAETGLRHPAQIMIDKPTFVPRARIGQRIGRLDAATLARVDRALAAFLDLEAPHVG